MEKTLPNKKVVETYVYDMIYKIRILSFQLNDKYQEFVIASKRTEFITKLDEVEGWLREDNEDKTKVAYIVKLEELKKVRHFG
ncbi:heat shock 70 kDa protein, putative [Medicago truncatula]|uniref:Heat shock 70 kDa protein, putative n=1 Tax=Medicago truncatula TaxID=3880 RepID=G7I9Z2_MEDTR|nr:heat shock 70 kDa protein, putative [Medicago truncatula]